MPIAARFERHLDGPAGIRAVWQIAFPMVVSSASETVMLFFDRLFLSRLGPSEMAAAMSGGMTAFTMMTFFIGLIGYSTALVAQNLGAGKSDRCAVAAAQGLLIALAAYPVIVAAIPLGTWLLVSAGHGELQQACEVRYFRILALGSIFGLLRNALAAFFSGVGRTRVVMVANLVAMAVNIVANYLLIFGEYGFPRLEITGAALGTVLGGAAGCLVIGCAYFGPACHRRFHTRTRLRPDRATMATLLRFGYPAGLELLLNMAAFNTFIQLFHSYGDDVAAACTIAFNWDLVAFIPMLGVNIATVSLVGRHMGAGAPELAENATWSALKLAYIYAGAMALLFLTVPELLVASFASADAERFHTIAPLAVRLLRMASLYTLADATSLVFSGALRGAGDTQWAMRISVALHWAFALAAIVLIRVVGAAPATVWAVFVAIVMAMGAVFFLRFRHGSWKQIRIIESDPPPGTAGDHTPRTPPPRKAPAND